MSDDQITTQPPLDETAGSECEWEVTTCEPWHCRGQAAYTDPSGKRLCKKHGDHLISRWGHKMTPIQNNKVR